MGDASAERCELAAEELLREGHAEAAALRCAWFRGGHRVSGAVAHRGRGGSPGELA